MPIDNMNQPFLQNMGEPSRVAPTGMTPEMMAKIAAGKSASRGLSGQSNNPANIQALRNANTPFAQMQGKGLAATAPTGLEVLGRTALRGRGEMDLAAQAKEASALRDQAAEGDMAQLEAGVAQQNAQLAAQQATAATKAAASVEAATQADIRARAIDEAANTAKVEAARIKAEGDAEQKRLDRIAKKEAASISAKNKGTGLKPTGSERKTYIEAGRLSGVVDEINQMRSEFTPEEIEQVNQPWTESAVDMVLPAAMQRRAEDAMYTSDNVKTYKTRLSRVESKLSQLAAGLNVTGYEMKDRQKWSPNAPGIDDEERQLRVANVQRDLQGQVESFEQYYPDYSNPKQDDSALSPEEAAELAALEKQFGGGPQ